MGIIERREQEKEEMREIILNAATKIINSEGYEKLSMRKIANEIDYSATTIYSYYKDKAQIIDDILNKIYIEIVINVVDALNQNEDLSIEGQFELISKVFINTMVKKEEMGKAVIRSGSNRMFEPTGDVEEFEMSGVAMLQSLIDEGQEQSIFRETDDNISWMIITALLGFCMNAIENKMYLNEDWDKLVDDYVKLLSYGLVKKGEV